MPTPHLLVDGRCGVTLEIPVDWQPVKQADAAGLWATPEGALVRFEKASTPVVCDPGLVEDYRQDLRLAAAQQGGGLVECSVRPGFGVVGITKVPQESGHGTRVLGHALVPTGEGHVYFLVVADEGAETGYRELGAVDATEGTHWVADPYGFSYEAARSEAGAWRHAPPEGLLLCCSSDHSRHDARFPDHPLTRVRALLDFLERSCVVDHGPPRDPTPGEPFAVGEDTFSAPAGFVVDPEARRSGEHVYTRSGLGGRLQCLSLRSLPEGCAASGEEARWVVEDYLAALGAEPVQGPFLRVRELGGEEGVFAECEYRREGTTRYLAAFVVPRSVSALGIFSCAERDNWQRAGRDLAVVAQSLGSVDDSGVTGGHDRITKRGGRRIYAGLVRTARCGGPFTLRQERVLRSWRSKLGIPERKAERIEAEVGDDKLSVGRRRAEQELLLQGMIEVAGADGAIDDAAERLVFSVGRTVGRSRGEVTDLLVRALAGL